MANQTLDEMELSILVNGTDRSMAEVFTDDSVWVERLHRQGWQPYKVKGISHFYRIPVNKIVSLRNVETKPISAARLAALHRARISRLSAPSLAATEERETIAA